MFRSSQLLRLRRNFSTGARSTAGSRSRESTERGFSIFTSALAFCTGGAGVAFYLSNNDNSKNSIYQSTPAYLDWQSDEKRRKEAIHRRQQQQQVTKRGNGGGDTGGASSSGSGAIKSMVVLGGVTLVSLLAFALTRYKRCSPNEVLVVFGQVGKTPGQGPAKLVHGGGTFVWPIIQDFRHLSLEPFAIEVSLHKALSKEKVRVSVPSVFTLAIGEENGILEKAALRLLDMENEDIEHQANEIITGQLRQVIASMSIDEINADREKFESTIRHNAEKELNKVGLVLINVNITNIEDDSGLIEAMGKKATAEVVQKALVDVAIAERHGAIGQAEQERDKNIGVAKNIQESSVKTAEFNALQVRGENISKQSIANSNSELQVAEAEAYKIGEIKQRQARAAVLEAESAALASAALAEATKVEAEKRSELEAPAKAMKAKIIVDSEAQAEQSRIHAEGEAQANFLKYEAEARGNFELLARKAEGLGMIVNETGSADDAFRLLMVDNIPKLAETSAQAISNIKFDKVVVWDSGNAANGSGTATSNFIRGLTGALPPAADVLRSVGGIDGFDKILLKDSSAADMKALMNSDQNIKLFQDSVTTDISKSGKDDSDIEKK